MKYVFSTKNVNCSSFIELCNVAKEYNFSGFEVNDAFAEKTAHQDSIFKSVARVGSKRKLINRHIAVSALTFPTSVDENFSTEDLVKYVDYAVRADSQIVIVSLSSDVDLKKAVEILSPAVKTAETLGVSILIETKGKYANTSQVLEVINALNRLVQALVGILEKPFLRRKKLPTKLFKRLAHTSTTFALEIKKTVRTALQATENYPLAIL